MNFKDFIQRGKRGFSDSDLWSLDSYLLKLIPNALNTFVEQDTIGIPFDIFQELSNLLPEDKQVTEEMLKEGREEWRNKIKQTAEHFNKYFQMVDEVNIDTKECSEEEREKRLKDYYNEAYEHLHIGFMELEDEIKRGYLWW